jgi:hypothetical protein
VRLGWPSKISWPSLGRGVGPSTMFADTDIFKYLRYFEPVHDILYFRQLFV